MRISEVSEQCDLSADTLRYYERIGLLPPVNRNQSGVRDYSDLDLRRIKFVKCMRRTGIPLETLIEYYGLVQEGDQTIQARKEMLKTQRRELLAKMEEIQRTIELVDHKIRVYEEIVLEKEKEMSQIEV